MGCHVNPSSYPAKPSTPHFKLGPWGTDDWDLGGTHGSEHCAMKGISTIEVHVGQHSRTLCREGSSTLHKADSTYEPLQISAP